MKLPFWATIFTLIGIIILCGLGSWQVKRLQWKTTIIEKLDEQYAQPENSVINFENTQDFYYGGINGVFLPDKALLLGPKTKDGKIGKDLIVPLDLEQGTLLVNMGWTDIQDKKNLPIHHLKGKRIKFSGLARKPDWNIFTSQNSPTNDLWFRADIQEIATVKELKETLPYILYAQSANYKFDAAFPNNERWYPRNKHRDYALFWFCMAFILAVVYTAYVRKKN